MKKLNTPPPVLSLEGPIFSTLSTGMPTRVMHIMSSGEFTLVFTHNEAPALGDEITSGFQDDKGTRVEFEGFAQVVRISCSDWWSAAGTKRRALVTVMHILPITITP